MKVIMLKKMRLKEMVLLLLMRKTKYQMKTARIFLPEAQITAISRKRRAFEQFFL